MNYCPNCVIELVPNTKKLGALTKWSRCPKCGHRERSGYDEGSSKAATYASVRIKRENLNLNQFNTEDYDFRSR